jgi:integrase
MAGFVERRGQGRWRGRYRAPDGRERSKTFTRKVDAERWLSGIQVALTRGDWNDPIRARMTVGDWSEQWLAAKRPTLKATTVESYRSLLSTCILPTWGRVPLAAVGHAEIGAWLARLSSNVGPSRCRKAATVLSGMLSAAVRDQRLSRNPCDGLTLPRLPEQQHRFLAMAELRELADCADPYRTMILVLGLCGLWIGECSALRMRSVDLLRRRLRVSESVSDVGGHQVFSSTKTHQARDVPLPQVLVDLVAAQMSGRAPSDLLFASPEGGSIRIGNWRRRVWVPAVIAAELEPLNHTTCGTPPRRWRSPPGRVLNTSSGCSATRMRR